MKGAHHPYSEALRTGEFRISLKKSMSSAAAVSIDQWIAIHAWWQEGFFVRKENTVPQR